MMDIVDALIESEALKISPPGELFFYTSGTVGPYYINTHFLYGGPEPAGDLQERVSVQLDEDARYRDVIDELTEAILAAESDAPSTWVSGGARRDWFFSLAVADRLERPHLFLFKDGRAADVDDDGQLRFVDDLTDETTVHVADLVTEASSYERAWIPAIRDRGGEMTFSANVVDRAQGGMKVLDKAGVPATALLRVDEDLFDALRQKNLVEEQQHETLTAYFRDPQKSMAAFLKQNPDFLQAALSCEDERTKSRARQLVKQDPYTLGLSL
jgi:orotate phosphoribosyltransferase